MSKSPKKSIPIEKIVIGMSASIKKVIEFDDIKLFAKLSGDTNAIHLDKEYAANSKYKKNSFGTFSILWLIEYCINHGIPYLYLGYWINQSNKMRYKINFKPYELMIDSSWQEASS